MNIKPFPNKKIVDLKEILTKRGDHVTHGDLIIIKCDEKDHPKDFDKLKDCPDGVLALGEFTGHAHKLEYDFEDSGPKLKSMIGEKQKSLKERMVSKMVSPFEMYLKVFEPVLLKHQEHNFFRIYPGNYEIGIQVERNPYDDQIRSLRD